MDLYFVPCEKHARCKLDLYSKKLGPLNENAAMAQALQSHRIKKIHTNPKLFPFKSF